MCVGYQRNSKTNNSRTWKFGILSLYPKEMLSETFCDNRTTSLSTGSHKIIPLHYDIWTKFLVNEILMYLDSTKCNEINTHFGYALKHASNRIKH